MASATGDAQPVGLAEVALEKIAEVVEVLHDERLVEEVVGAHLGDRLLGGPGVRPTQDQQCGVAGDDEHGHERERRSTPPQDGHSQQESQSDSAEGDHVSLRSRRW